MLDILVHIALQDGIEGSQKPNKAVSVNCCNFNFRHSNNICCTRLTLEQGSLTEVITWAILFNLDWLSLSKRFCSDGIAANNDVEVVTLVTFSEDFSIGGVCCLFDGVSYFASLVVINTLQNGHRREEVLISISLVLSCIFHNVVECVAIKLPERAFRL